MRISVIGTGYVGLVAGACFADTGNDVVCVDKDASKIEALRRGEIPIFEPGLETLVKRGVAEGRLRFTTSVAEAVPESAIIFLAVGTPPTESGEPDLRQLEGAAKDIAPHLKNDAIIVNKSTVPIGSHRVVADWIIPLTNARFHVVSNPEFLKEGSAVEDFLRPDRVVIGTENQEVYERMAELYSPFVRQGNPVIWTDPVSAEMIKYACNSFLAARISFMNELAALCEKVGGDIEEVRRGMSTDVRIGKHFLYAGAGYGGSCFPKDIQALMATGRKHQVPLGIIAATEAANERQKRVLGRKIAEHFGGALKGKRIAVWGLAFKPNTDDLRDASALVLIDELVRQGALVQAFDPVAMPHARKLLGNRIEFANTAYDALKGADALAIVTEWNEFRHPDFERMKSLMAKPVVFDGRNVLRPAQMRELGFTYQAIGRSGNVA